MITKIFNTLFTGKFLLQIDETTSTNSLMKDWLSNNKPIDGTVILTENQTAGRGQAGNTWKSAPGMNLTFSLLYLCKFLEVKDQFLLSAAISLGLRNAVQQMLPDADVKIKWPNDILVNQQKVAGILIENTLQGHFLHYSIVGIGLNVLQEDFDGLPNASSLKKNGFEGNKENALSVVLEEVEKQFLLLRNNKFEGLIQNYHRHLFGKDEWRNFLVDDKIIRGTITGVEKSGRLNVEFESGMRQFWHKEIGFL